MQAPSGNISLTVDETAGNVNGIFNGEWTIQEIEKRRGKEGVDWAQTGSWILGFIARFVMFILDF